MNEISTLTGLELKSLFGINKIRHIKDKKEKSKYIALAVAWVMVVGVIAFYVAGLVFGLSVLGLSDIAPGYLIMVSALLVLIFGIFKAGGMVFAKGGYDILVSMPIRASSIVASRFLVMYIEELLLCLLVMLPGAATYGILEHPATGFYIAAAIGTLFVPAIPLVISTVIGTVVMAISSRMKHKSLVQTLLMLVLVCGVFIGPLIGFNSESITPERIGELVGTVGDIIAKSYPPAMWMGSAMINGNIPALLLFAGVSAAAVVLLVWIVSGSFHSVMRRLYATTSRHSYKIGELQSSGLTRALLRREAKRYFSSGVYVSNTIVGPVLGCIASGVALFAGADAIEQFMALDIIDSIDIIGMLSFGFSTIFCMMTTTSVSISMEGKQFWVIKSMPIPAKALLDSKLLLNLLIMLPFFAASEVMLILAFKPGVIDAVFMVLIPALMMLFAVVFGIWVNLRLHSFDWEKEEAVVKQSASSAIGGLGGAMLPMLLCIAVLFVPTPYPVLEKAALCLIVAVVTLIMYNSNNKTILKNL